MTVAEQHDQPELATGDGGGVWTDGGTMTVKNSTVTGNHAVNGSGILAVGPLGWLTLKTTTV